MVKVEEIEGVTVLRIKGDITIRTPKILVEALDEVISRGVKRVVVDMSNVYALDSYGVGELVSLLTTAYNHKILLALSALTPKLKDILTITQMIDVITYADSLEKAVTAVREGTFEEFVQNFAYRKID